MIGLDKAGNFRRMFLKVQDLENTVYIKGALTKVGAVSVRAPDWWIRALPWRSTVRP